MKKIRSKKNNLLNYFICDHKDLSKNYLKSCNNFFEQIKKKEPTEKLKELKKKGLINYDI